jgi:hypothetical protein
MKKKPIVDKLPPEMRGWLLSKQSNLKREIKIKTGFNVPITLMDTKRYIALKNPTIVFDFRLIERIINGK